jgi:hypothetical protein
MPDRLKKLVLLEEIKSARPKRPYLESPFCHHLTRSAHDNAPRRRLAHEQVRG